MSNRPNLVNKKKDNDIIFRIANTASEEVEKFGTSVTSQIAGESAVDQPNPIAEAMQQKTEEEEIEKQNLKNKQRKFIQTQEELNEKLKMLQREDEEKKKAWAENVDRQFNIVSPGQSMDEKPALPLSSKPKRGQMPGKPGSA